MAMDAIIIFCANYLIWLMFLFAAGFFLVKKQWQGMALLIVSIVASIAAGKLLGLLWYDPLPFVVNGTTPLFPHDANNGFPSDHTLITTAIALSVAVYRRYLGAGMLLLAIVVGGARVIAGVHHWVDIAAALVVAALCTAGAYALLRRYRILAAKEPLL